MIEVETPRLLLRPIHEMDVQGIFELDSDPEVHRYLGNRPIQTMKEAEGIVAYIQEQYETYGFGRWAVIDKESKEFVGWSGLKYETKVREDMDYNDLGYRLKRKFWGLGIATETALEALKFGFETLGLDEIYAGAAVNNIGSNKVLKKVGFQQLETFQYDGADIYWYGMERDAWSNKNEQQRIGFNSWPVDLLWDTLAYPVF